ncbi:hypothetical protein HYY74_05855 [Candidatus Woesearchaeota archaeon]|nr:hypothetical protein [Candidatus Woesearchaeota archaeon]
MSSISVPFKVVDGKAWLLLDGFSSTGLLRAVRIEKRKKQVLDWDGHHCDEASG